MKFYIGELGPDPEDWMIYEVKYVVPAGGKNYNGELKYRTRNESYRDLSIEEFEYKRDYDALSCKYFCKVPE